MGAVEAALYHKPVIITDYGAPSEYIKTKYLIECGRQEILEDDFLFQKGMVRHVCRQYHTSILTFGKTGVG